MKRVDSGVRSFTADSSGVTEVTAPSDGSCSKDVEYIEKEGCCGECLLKLAPPEGEDSTAYIMRLGQAAQSYFGRPDFKIVSEAVATQSEDAARLARLEVKNYIGFVFIQEATGLSAEQQARSESIRILAGQLPFPAICVPPTSVPQWEQTAAAAAETAPQHPVLAANS